MEETKMTHKTILAATALVMLATPVMAADCVAIAAYQVAGEPGMDECASHKHMSADCRAVAMASMNKRIHECQAARKFLQTGGPEMAKMTIPLITPAAFVMLSAPVMAGAPDYYINIERGACQRRHLMKPHETIEHCARRLEALDKALAKEDPEPEGR
jgi:hypothetical protein